MSKIVLEVRYNLLCIFPLETSYTYMYQLFNIQMLTSVLTVMADVIKFVTTLKEVSTVRVSIVATG